VSAQISSATQLVLGLVLIGLALSLVRLGLGNLRSVRGSDAPAAEPSDD